MQKRIIWDAITQHLTDDKTVVITGPRRVGKTTTLHWILDQIDTSNSIYFDFENVINRDLFLARDYNSLLNEFQNLGLDIQKRMYIAIDEIQYVPNLPSIVKYLQDTYQIKFFLSGSSSYYLKNLFSESLSGRKVIIELFPLTFSEFLTFQGAFYQIHPFSFDRNALFNTHAFERLQTYYVEYIEFGGLPPVALAGSREEKRKILEDVYSSYINIDVQSLSDFKSLQEFRKLVSLLAARVGSKVNTNELATILGVSRVTIESYLEFMSKTYLIRLVPASSASVDVSTRKQEKLYFVDTGIAGINADLSSGAKFENTVTSQLAYHRSVSYYEHRTKEIDIIVDGSCAIEVKQLPTAHDLRILNQRADTLGIKSSFLVGQRQNAGFDQYVWGGELG